MNNVAIIIAVLSLQNVFSQVNLTDTTNQYDYVIITVPEFVASCEVFAQHKENVKGLKSLVVDTTMILNEFNSDSLVQDNIREFISYAGTFWKEPQPKYFLLVGNLTKIPTHTIFVVIQTFYSDFPYSQSIYDDDSLSVEFYIGRVPADNINETNNYFNKVINYESDENLYAWNNNSLFFAEHDFNDQYALHQRTLQVANTLPGFINKSFLLEYDSSSANSLKDSLVYFINSKGMSSVWFFRLPINNDSAFGYTNFFTIEDIELLNNSEKPFVFFNMTTQSLSNDSTNFNKEFLLSENGSIAAITPVGIVWYPTIIYQLQVFAANLYLPDPYSLGAVMEQSFSDYLKPIINLWGDPSLKLKYDVTTDVKPVTSFPTEYNLEQNYPNPFNPLTTIRFSLPFAGNVELKIYNILGKEVSALPVKFYEAGKYEIKFDGSSLSSGVYFYTIRSGDFYQTRKMILLR